MSVSFPRGVKPPTTSAMKSAVPAVAKPPVKGKKGGSDPLHHHGKIAAALKVGDHKAAMHHTGHMMLAIRSAAKATGLTVPSISPDQIATSDTSSGTDDGLTSPTLPAKKPFSRGTFGAIAKRATQSPHKSLQNAGV